MFNIGGWAQGLGINSRRLAETQGKYDAEINAQNAASKSRNIKVIAIASAVSALLLAIIFFATRKHES